MGIVLVCYTIPYPHWLFSFPIPRTGEIAFVIEIVVLQAVRLSKLLICGNFPAFSIIVCIIICLIGWVETLRHVICG
jgi:hypothetical protein